MRTAWKNFFCLFTKIICYVIFILTLYLVLIIANMIITDNWMMNGGFVNFNILMIIILIKNRV